jgi:hypothetical protein
MDPLILEAIARLKRAQPRNADTILVCTALEALLYKKEAAKPRYVSRWREANPDRYRTYMRDYMRRQRRAQAVALSTS